MSIYHKKKADFFRNYFSLFLLASFIASIVFFAQPIRAADDGIVFEDEGFEVPAEKSKKAVKFGEDKKADAKKSQADTKESKESKAAEKASAGSKKTDKAEAKESDSADKKADDKKQSAEEEDFEVIPGLTDKYARIAEQGRVSEETQKKFLKIQIAQERALLNYDKKNQPTIARYEKKMAREDDDRKLQKKYQAKIDKIAKQRVQLEFKHEIMALKVLTKEESARRNSTMLWNAISPDMTMLNLSDDQMDQARKICDEYGAKSRRPLLDQTVDKASLQVSKKLVRSVLNKVQQKEYKRFLMERMRENRR